MITLYTINGITLGAFGAAVWLAFLQRWEQMCWVTAIFALSFATLTVTFMILMDETDE